MEKICSKTLYQLILSQAKREMVNSTPVWLEAFTPMSEKQLVRCPSCGVNNRVDPERIAQGSEAVCAQCKRPLPALGEPVIVTDASFASEVELSTLPVLLDLWAPWCGPCRMIAPVLEQLAAEMAGRVRIAKLNVDENQATAARFNVRSIPTLLILKSGREIDRLVGVLPKSEIARRLEQVLGSDGRRHTAGG
jgi:thioredoxin 2